MNKFILCSLLLLSLLGIASSNSPQIFDPIKRHDGFQTSTNLRASYAQKCKQDGRHVAHVHFKTKMPSCNLDQREVCGIECKDGKIIVSLSDNSPMEEIRNWPDKVFVFVSHKWKCYGKETTQYYMVGHRTIDSHNKKVTFTAKKCDLDDVTENFDINVSWEDKQRYTRRQFGFGKIDVSKSAKIPLNVFFDPKTGKSTQSFTILELGQNNNVSSQSLVCDNCFANGVASVSFRIAGTILPLRVTDLTLALNGNLGINIELAFNGKIAKSITEEIPIASIPLSPFAIPGIAIVGPSLDLVSSAALSDSMTGSLNTGVAITFPNFNAKAQFVDIINPKFSQSGFTPQTKILDTSVGVTVSTSFSVSPIKPQIAFGLDVLNGRFKRKAGFELDPSISNEFSIGKGSGCKKITQLKFTHKVAASVGFFVGNAKFAVFEFPPSTLVEKCFV